MAKNNQSSSSGPRGRTSKRLSPSSKSFANMAQILHVDGKNKQHFIDVGKSQIWQGEFLKRINVPEASKMQSAAALGAAGFADMGDDADKKITFEDYLKESSLVKNLCFDDGRWVEKYGDEYTDWIIKSRQERLVYKTAHGAVKRPPKQRASDTEKAAYTEPLKISFSRLPPWIASVLNPANPDDEKLVKKVAIEFAEAVAKETGLPVISANTHRENERDLHIHLVQSIVVPNQVRKKLPIKEQAKLLRPLTEKVRDLMKAEKDPTHPVDVDKLRDELGIDADGYRKMQELMEEHNNSTHPSIVKKIRDALGIEAPEYRDEVTEWQRVLRADSKVTGWPIAKRSTKVLGTAYRCKAEIMDAAETAADKEAVRKTHEVDFLGSFSSVFCASEDRESDFIDYWAEKTLERLVLDNLTPEQKKESYKLKKKAVSDYIEFGTTTPSPLDHAILQAEKEKLEELQEREIAILEKEQAVMAAGEQALSELEERETIISERENLLRCEGRNELKDEILAVLPKSDAEKTDEEAIAKVKEVTGKARLLDKIKPMIKDVLAGVSKLPGLPGRLEKRISKLRDLLFPSENSPRFS